MDQSAVSVAVTIENKGPSAIRVGDSGNEIPPGGVYRVMMRELVSIRLDSGVTSVVFSSTSASTSASTTLVEELPTGKVLSLLCDACAAGDLDVVAAAKKVLSADDLRRDNNRPILYASANGQLAAAQRVFETFGLTAADLRVRGDNALWLACSNGHLAVAKWLTRTGRLKVEDVLAVRRTFEDAAEAQTDREFRWQVGLNTIRDLLAEFTIGTE